MDEQDLRVIIEHADTIKGEARRLQRRRQEERTNVLVYGSRPGSGEASTVRNELPFCRVDYDEDSGRWVLSLDQTATSLNAVYALSSKGNPAEAFEEAYSELVHLRSNPDKAREQAMDVAAEMRRQRDAYVEEIERLKGMLRDSMNRITRAQIAQCNQQLAGLVRAAKSLLPPHLAKALPDDSEAAKRAISTISGLSSIESDPWSVSQAFDAEATRINQAREKLSKTKGHVS